MSPEISFVQDANQYHSQWVILNFPEHTMEDFDLEETWENEGETKGKGGCRRMGGIYLSL